MGESYALALAIADKMTRLGSGGSWVTICATGSMPSDGCGDIKRIRAFEAKIDLFIQQSQEGSLFVFPAANLSEPSEEIIDKLNQLKAKGVKCIAIRNINDLEGVIWQSSPAKKKYDSKNIKLGYQYWQEITTRIPRIFLWAGYVATFILVAIITVIVVTNTTNEQKNGREHKDSAIAAVNEDVTNEPNKNTTEDSRHPLKIKQAEKAPAIESGDIDTTPY